MTRIKIFIFCVFLGYAALCKAQERNLDYFLNKGISNSPLLHDYQNQLLSAKIDSAILKATFRPQVSAGSTGMYAPVIHGYGYDEAITNGQTLDALISVNQTITGRNRINTQLQDARLLSDSIRNQSAISELDLRKTITDQYITAYASSEQLRFNQEVYDLLKGEDLILKKLTRSNVYTQTDYLAFLVTLKQQKLQTQQTRITFLNDLAVLNYLSGISDTSSVTLAEPDLVIENPVKSKSLFLEQYHLDSLRLENERKLIDLNYKPRAGVYADAGYNSSFILQPYKNFGASAGFTLSVPIYDGHQRKLQQSKIDIAEKTRKDYKSFFITRHQQQINLLMQQLEHTRQLGQQINEQIRYTRSLIKVDAELLQTGDLRISDYIIAINNYLNAQNVVRQTNISRLQLINQLNYWNQ